MYEVYLQFFTALTDENLNYYIYMYLHFHMLILCTNIAHIHKLIRAHIRNYMSNICIIILTHKAYGNVC